MTEVGIRALKQNASAVVARAALGESVTITDRGRPVAVLSPLPDSPMERLIRSGRARPARGDERLSDLPAPEPWPGGTLSSVVADMRAEERY